MKASPTGNAMTRTQKDGDDMVTGKVGLTARGRKLLSHLRVARDKSGLDDFGLPSELIEGMVQSGFLELQDETMPPVDYQDDFAGWKSQRGMLIDHIRTLAFQHAITAVVQPGDRVVDVGTGSGILAMMAARQGAAEVYALEVTDMASWAARIAEKNGLSAMRVLRGDAAAFEAPGPVDVIMGEFAGMYFLEDVAPLRGLCGGARPHLARWGSGHSVCRAPVFVGDRQPQAISGARLRVLGGSGLRP